MGIWDESEKFRRKKIKGSELRYKKLLQMGEVVKEKNDNLRQTVEVQMKKKLRVLSKDIKSCYEEWKFWKKKDGYLRRTVDVEIKKSWVLSKDIKKYYKVWKLGKKKIGIWDER